MNVPASANFVALPRGRSIQIRLLQLSAERRKANASRDSGSGSFREDSGRLQLPRIQQRCPRHLYALPHCRMAKALKTDTVADNLLQRRFEEFGPRKALLTDITYIINGKAPRCYMSTIIDACTKELLGWVLSDTLEIDFVLETVEIVLRTAVEQIMYQSLL